jgi:heme/copper-type cytochrome/quinol oxidase subunit 2
MTKSKKVWLGILTFLPIIFIGIFIFLFITLFLSNIYNFENNLDAQQVDFYRSMIIAFVFIVFAVIIRLVLLIYYLIHVSDNKNNDNTKKIMWILILVFVGTIGSIIYYFMEIYPLKIEQEMRNGNE